MTENKGWDVDINANPDDVVSPEIRKQRTDICDTCERLTQDKICMECGCVMSVKTWFKLVYCPLLKW